MISLRMSNDMMSAEVLFVGSIICLISSFFKPFDSFYPIGILMLVMAVSIWVRERKRQ